jgi:outer membrane biosynthesis protein TonB
VVPIAVGVVLLGFVIGAAIPALRRAPSSTVAVSTAAPTPAPRVQPVAKAVPTPSAEPTPSPKPVPKPTVRVRPSEPATRQPTPTSKPRPTASARPSSSPAATPRATATALPTSAPTRAPTNAPVAQPAIAHDATRVVRWYLESLMRGDETGARALLDAAPGSPNAQLVEEAFVDKSARIVEMTARTLSPTSAEVDTNINSPKGPYFARYTVERTRSGAVLIRQHDYIKP